ncbi:hypothetical protein ACI79G_16230 [Geodermatophilus sp. SYSU D00779]
MTPCAASACPLTVLSWRLGAVPLTDLWWRYTVLGGHQPHSALAAYLVDAAAWPAAEHNVLAQTLNENLWDLGLPSLAPLRELQEALRRTAPETGHGRRAGASLLPATPAPPALPLGQPTAGPSSLPAVAVAEGGDVEDDLAARTAALWHRARAARLAAERAHQQAERTRSLSRTNRELTRLRRHRTA